MADGWTDVDGQEAEQRLRALRRRLGDLDLALQEQQALAREYPASFAMELSARSLLSMQSRIRDDIVAIVRHRSRETVSVALSGPVYERHSAKVGDLGVLLTRLQRLYSSIGQAVSTGPRLAGPIPYEIQTATELRLDSTYPSSFGMTLSCASSFDLIGNSLASDSLQQLFSVLSSEPDDATLKRVSGELGRRALNHLRHIASLLASSNTSLRANWKDYSGIRHEALVSSEKAQSIVRVLSSFSEKQVRERVVEGYLVGASLIRSRFEFMVDGGTLIEGKYASSIDLDVQESFGRRATAKLIETEVVDRATDATSVYYSLTAITNAPAPAPR